MRGRESLGHSGTILLLLTLLSVPQAGAQQRDVTVTPATYQGLTLYQQSWAVVVGVDQFKTPKISRLNYAANDARSVARALVALGFPEKNITLLLNQQATRSEIERVLGSVVRKATAPQDRLVIFFATHGVTASLPYGGEEGYLLPYDADPDDLPVTALAMQQLKQMGQRIPAKHILVAVDACYGGYSLVRAQAPPVVDRRYLELLGKSRTIQVLTAGRKDQPVIEEQGHGVFTRKLLDGLAGHADVNGDGLVTLGELGAWMHPRVAQASEYKQDMQWGTLDGEGQVVFVLPETSTAGTVRAREDEAHRLEAERRRLQEERRKLEEEKRVLEEQKRLKEEREQLEAERRQLEEEQRRLQAAAARRQAEELERRRIEEERRRIDLSGHYDVMGRNPGGGAYSGQVAITKRGSDYDLRWRIANQIHTGIGSLSGRNFKVRWGTADGGAIGEVIYTVLPDGSLSGTWTIDGRPGQGTETLTPRR